MDAECDVSGTALALRIDHCYVLAGYVHVFVVLATGQVLGSCLCSWNACSQVNQTEGNVENAENVENFMWKF